MAVDLPIHSILPDLRAALAGRRAVVLSAPTGSGKTTGVPLALLDEKWLDRRRVLMLEPRRLAARMAAHRMAALLGEEVGATVGYQVRFDRVISPATRIEVLTEGILTRRLQADPELAGVGLVIFDEFHERSIHADLALALCLDVMASLRDDLKLLVMSATLEIEPLARLLGDAGVVVSSGKSFPVEVRYLSGNGPQEAGYDFTRTVSAMTRAIRRTAGEEQGDILAFLPGAGEIRAAAEKLADWAQESGILICPLYGDLPKEAQDAAVMPDLNSRRRVVLTTSIAETSLTIEGVRVVIDSGWSRASRFDPNSGLSRLTTLRVSRAAAEQRAGRASRLEPGVCYRLWPQLLDQSLQPYAMPEVQAADLAPLALELALWGVSQPVALRWLDPLPAGNFSQARELLTLLGALDRDGRLSPLGKRMAELGVHPRLARMLLAAGQIGAAELACDLAALITERDIIGQVEGGDPRPVDIEARLHLLTSYRRGRAGEVRSLGGDPAACLRVERAARQYRGLLPGPKSAKVPPSAGGLLVLAYPDRIARLRPDSVDRYQLSSGRGARLPKGDHLTGTPYLVAPQLDAGRAEGRLQLAAAITEAELFQRLAEKISTIDRVAWDERLEQVVACCEEQLFALVLTSRPLEAADPERIREAMLEGIRRLGLAALPWSDEVRGLQARILSLRFWQPEEDWPDVSDEGLAADITAWLSPYLAGLSRRQHLARLDLGAILRQMLDWRLQQRLEIEAPTHITAPSGSRLRLRYKPGGPPVLAVRLQEMFGLADTPRVASGRVAVMLHLLSPAGRPVQVTQDLRSFWNSTYQEVKKQLKGRYPRHHWPDDPWSAAATARAKRRENQRSGKGG